MCDPIIFVILFLMFVIIVALTKYISLGSVMCMLLYPILQDTLSKFALKIIGEGQYNPYVIFPFCMMLLIVLKHWPNIKRLLSGKESKFSFKKSVKAPDESKAENAEATNDSDTKNTQA